MEVCYIPLIGVEKQELLNVFFVDSALFSMSRSNCFLAHLRNRQLICGQRLRTSVDEIFKQVL